MPSQRSPEHLAFGRAVRRRREQLGLSQEQLGYKSGLHRNYIGGVERGELNASLQSINRLSAGLDIRPSELLALAEQLQTSARTD